jgi:hypothetical protein
MIEVWRAQFAASPLAAVLVDGAAPLEPLRAQVQALSYRDYFIADRGRYQFNDSFQSDGLEPLIGLAQQITGKTITCTRARCTRHVHGDYAQPKDDDRFWPRTGATLELTIDLSNAASDEGQIVYFNASGSLVLPQKPGACALIARTAPLTRYERYLNYRLADNVIYRLRLLLLLD